MVAGRDGTEGFNDVGHSEDARSLLRGFLIGTVEGSTQQVSATTTGSIVGRRACLELPTDCASPSLMNKSNFRQLLL